MSMIVGTCSMKTGHSSMQAPQVTQSQICSKPTPSMRSVGVSGFFVDGRTARFLLFHEQSDVVDDVLGRQQLAGDVRRAGIGAAAALRAGVGVEELLPGEVLQLADAEALGLLDVRDRREDAGWLECGG